MLVYWERAKVVAATGGFDQEINFPLPRSGKLRRMPILSIKATTTGATATGSCDLKYSALNCWSRIELVSKTAAECWLLSD